MDQPRISVVTPSLNQAEFLEQNIRSVLSEGYPDLEHIVVDGGSTDASIEVLRKYGHLVWTSGPDGGQSDALNRGFRKCTGDIVGWLNSDDTYCPGVFGHVLRAFNDPAVMVVCGDGYEIDRRGNIVKNLNGSVVDPRDIIPYWRWKYAFVQPSFFFRRTVFDSIGYLDERLHFAMDYDFLVRCGLRYPIRYLSVPLANLRLYDESKTGREISSPVPAYIREMHTVSFRHWGGPADPRFYGYALSFLAAIAGSFVKNLLLFPGSKSRRALQNVVSRR